MERNVKQHRFANDRQYDINGYPRVRYQVNDDLIRSYLSALNTPRALAVWLLYDAGEHLQLIELPFDPLWYCEKDLEKFRSDYAATSFLAKSDFLDTHIDRKAVAVEKVFLAENMCATTNRRVRNFTPGGYADPGLFHTAIVAMQEEIARILGEFVCDELFEHGDFGPGVTLALKGKKTDRAYKYHFESGITRDLYDLVGTAAQAAYPSWHVWQETPQYVPGNKVTFVSKNAKTDRSIAVEPGLNLFFQKGLGTMIRRRLLRVGINLNDQAKNQSLAERAYREKLATIDFSMASDTISYEVIKLLIPPRWFTVMDACRSKYGTLPKGQPKLWNKFSSMGNGFTFELESLIFYAAAKVAVLKTGGKRGDLLNTSVYGDDIILPQFASTRFIELAHLLGFSVNLQKSYTTGLFYESCGKHYFAGSDVTPIYLKHRVDSVSHLYKLHNAVRRLAARWSFTGCDARFQLTCHMARSLAPRSWQYRIPNGVGDGGFISNWDEARPKSARSHKLYIGWEGFVYHHIVDKPKNLSFDGHGLLLSRLRQVGNTTSAAGNKTQPRRLTTARKQITVVSEWIDLGPWQQA